MQLSSIQSRPHAIHSASSLYRECCITSFTLPPQQHPLIITHSTIISHMYLNTHMVRERYLYIGVPEVMDNIWYYQLYTWVGRYLVVSRLFCITTTTVVLSVRSLSTAVLSAWRAGTLVSFAPHRADTWRRERDLHKKDTTSYSSLHLDYY